MNITQAVIAGLAIALLGGGLYLCYMVIQINDADEAERRREQRRKGAARRRAA